MQHTIASVSYSLYIIKCSISISRADSVQNQANFNFDFDFNTILEFYWTMDSIDRIIYINYVDKWK